MLFAGSLQPLTELLNSWLLEGVLDDPFGEVHFLIEAEFIMEGKKLRNTLVFSQFPQMLPSFPFSFSLSGVLPWLLGK